MSDEKMPKGYTLCWADPNCDAYAIETDGLEGEFDTKPEAIAAARTHADQQRAIGAAQGAALLSEARALAERYRGILWEEPGMPLPWEGGYSKAAEERAGAAQERARILRHMKDHPDSDAVGQHSKLTPPLCPGIWHKCPAPGDTACGVCGATRGEP